MGASRRIAGALGVIVLTGLSFAGAAHADWRYERHHDWRRDEWERHHRVYYGPTYVAPPPPVYYAPPPPPSGLNLFFHVR